MSVLVALASLIIIFILVKFIFKKKNQRTYELLEQFPSHSTYPLIGNLHLLINPTEGMLEKFDKILQPYDRQVFWFGAMPILFLKKHDDIATVINQCQDRDTMGLADPWFGLGIVTARYKEWKKSRRMLNPAFNSEMFLKYLQIFNKNYSNFVKNLNSVADTGKEVDVLHRSMRVNLDCVKEGTLGNTIRNKEKSEQEFCNAILEAFASILQRAHFPFLYPNFFYKLYAKITKKAASMEHLKSYPSEVLRQKLNEYQGFQDQKKAVDEESTSQTVVDLLIKASLKEPDFNETRMRDELLQVIAAACEPTGLILSYFLLMLAIHQDVQQKVYEEIAQLPTSQDEVDGALTENDLDNCLGYTEQCIRETLRLYCPVATDIRRTHKEISLGDKIIPANILVVASIYTAHRDTELYKNPFKWDPEHFSDEAIQKRPKTGFLSFGYGPKFCLGYKYALMSIKIAIVFILRRYRLSTNLKELTHKDLYVDLPIKSKRGYPVQFTSR